MATESTYVPLTGSCACKTVTYSLLASPLITHCCHCTHCQRESGSAFVINTIVETFNFQAHSSTPLTEIDTPSASGKGQLIKRCPTCQVALYSHFGSGEKMFAFIRAGTLDEPSRKRIKPDVHIYTNSKVDWVDLGGEETRGAKICKEFYEVPKVWSEDALRRWGEVMAKEHAKDEGKSGE